MLKLSHRTIGALCVLALLVSLDGCRRHRKTTSAPNTTSYSDNIQPFTQTSHLGFLRWPDITDYQPLVKTFYEDRNYEIAWSRDGHPTPAAMGFMKAFVRADLHGLRPDDYDAPKWEGRIRLLANRGAGDVAEYDVAMTVAVMRFISDLRIGRVNPQHFNFDINVADKKYNLAEFVSDNAVDVSDVPALIKKVEPDSDIYRRTEQVLARYLEIERKQIQQNDDPLPEYERSLNVGDTFDDVPALARRLQLEGDLDADSSAANEAAEESTAQGSVVDSKERKPTPRPFTRELSEAVKRYQHRHGFTEDGKLTQQTIASLNIPIEQRVQQLGNTLERFRWLPDQYVRPRLMVNLPEFLLRGYTPDNQLDFTMRVVVGQVMGEHQTPVFAHMMRYLVFRPYWTVPVGIARKELVPHMNANKSYLESKNFEVVTAKGQPYPNYTVRQVEQGQVMVREKPGPKNSLGLVKFMFPNQYDVYLHSTPATQLFNRTRRDFSHGCIRVQKPEDLAVWVLDGQKDKDGEEWNAEKVHETMTEGKDNNQVNLKTPLPIVIFYMTAEVEEDGEVHFFDDIYHYDEQMEKVLEKGPPYPTKPEPVQPKTKPGETV